MVASRYSPIPRGAWGLAGWLEQRSLDLYGDGEASSSVPWAVWEEDDHLHLELDAPGVRQEDLEVTVHGDGSGRLQVRTERKSPDAAGRRGFDHRQFGSTDHSVTLPDTADVASAKASLRDGVLQVRFAKKPEVQAKRIEVKDGGDEV